MNAEGWAKKKVTVLGLGRSGSSAARYLAARGADIFLSEGGLAEGSKAEEAQKLKQLGIKVETGGHSEEALSSAELIIVSPGIPPSSPVITRAQALNKEIICDIELAARETEIPIIAITGTNGKSTTCALVSHILTTASFKAPSCGNFGVPILCQLENEPDYLVAEVSSFQSHYCQQFAPAVAVWLNLTPDHIEWHGGLNAYINAKQKLFAKQKLNQYAVLNEDDPIVANFEPPSEVFPFSVTNQMDYAIQAAFMNNGFLCYRMDGSTNLVCHQDDLKIIGSHNLENALAALSVAAVLGVPLAKAQEGLKSFCALEHRLEYVATIDGVRYFNDSKATNPNSTIKALEAFGAERIVLIAGGRDKGTSLGDLAAAVRKHVADVILLGEAKERFWEAFEEAGCRNLHSADSLAQAVDMAGELKVGPVVLSPACASFDMFRDYEERGRVFKNLVHTRLEKMAPSH